MSDKTKELIEGIKFLIEKNEEEIKELINITKENKLFSTYKMFESQIEMLISLNNELRKLLV